MIASRRGAFIYPLRVLHMHSRLQFIQFFVRHFATHHLIDENGMTQSPPR